jgi:hypothetical protein
MNSEKGNDERIMMMVLLQDRNVNVSALKGDKYCRQPQKEDSMINAFDTMHVDRRRQFIRNGAVVCAI